MDAATVGGNTEKWGAKQRTPFCRTEVRWAVRNVWAQSPGVCHETETSW